MTKAIILSAGQGRRLLPLTEATPKAALHAGRQSVLEWQLEQLGRTAVSEAVVVTGFGADKIDDIVAGQQYLPARTLYNPFYAQCDNLGTCWIARGEMTAPYLIINGDTLFEAGIVDKLLAGAHDHAVTLVTDSKATYDDDDMKVVVVDGQLQRVGKQLGDAPVNGESIGMMCFDARGATLFVNQIDHLMRYGSGIRQWYLSAIDQLAQDGAVGTCAIDGLSWCEIDDASDLEHAASVVAGWDGSAAAAAGAR